MCRNRGHHCCFTHGAFAAWPCIPRIGKGFRSGEKIGVRQVQQDRAENTARRVAFKPNARLRQLLPSGGDERGRSLLEQLPGHHLTKRERIGRRSLCSSRNPLTAVFT